MDDAKISGEVKRIFEEVKTLLNVPFVPRVFRAMAADPERLAATWERMKEVMMTGEADIRTKFVAAYSAALSSNNRYFASAYRAALQRLGATEQEIEELKQVVELNRELDRSTSRLNLRPDLEP
ncbi:MAG: hypothetical protein HY594_04525 [Candidatus Omnitrophica bacterium]|nr:hypothetical protein [Candidatus Omnitrophota bacterium]